MHRTFRCMDVLIDNSRRNCLIQLVGLRCTSHIDPGEVSMSRVAVSSSLMGLCLFSASQAALAQQATIQQPVVSQFRVDTVVSVPDGGRVFLGSVSSARDGSFRAGFTPIGSSMGREVSHQGADVSVFIHDLDELDRLTLAAGTTMENPWTGEVTQGGPEVDQGGRLSVTYSHRPPGEADFQPNDQPASGSAGRPFNPRGTAAFRTLQSRVRD